MTFQELKESQLPEKDVSVIIGFKDWGLDRLALSIDSLITCLENLNGEVIVSDYGSQNAHEVEELVVSSGARYVFTPTDGVWSRSRALNAGAAVSTGRVIITTDADMLFSPESINIVVQQISKDPHQAIVLQCRDLPERFDSAGVAEHGYDWDLFESVSKFRPRWGMGGMMAVSREVFLYIRGFDERMEIYGGEDMDFAQRVQWAGSKLRWIEDDSVRMFHMWHPSSRADVSQTADGRKAVNHNASIVSGDRSVIRNTVTWQHKPADAPILASVVISTRNRSAFLVESVFSALAQTVKDIEVIVVDDGSTDNTEDVIREIRDPRLRYFKREQGGLAAARNFAATKTRGLYTVVHDDDDIMLPDRIENHFKALDAGVQGTYGGWIDFSDNDVLDFKAHPGKEFSPDIVRFTGRVYVHGTMMVKSSLLSEIKYDETLRSGSDYSLAIRFAKSGFKFKHTGKYHILRRLHPHQVTHADSSFQQGSWSFTKMMGLQNLSPAQQAFMERQYKDADVVIAGGDKAVWKSMLPMLPDKAVHRTVVIPPASTSALPTGMTSGLSSWVLRDLSSGDVLATAGVVTKAKFRDLAEIASLNREASISAILQADYNPLDANKTEMIQHSFFELSAVGKALLDVQDGVIVSVVSETKQQHSPKNGTVFAQYLLETPTKPEYISIIVFAKLDVAREYIKNHKIDGVEGTYSIHLGLAAMSGWSERQGELD